MHSFAHRRLARALPWLAALFLSWLATGAFAQGEADPPGRVGFLTHAEGSIVFAPKGEEEWVDLPRNRPLTVGDRLWTDRGARAELQVGSASLHVDGESHVGISDLDDRAAQFIVQQGTVNARVRDLAQGENFEIDTPNMALRALQPGDYRVDVDPAGTTRVVVQSGMVAIYGEGGSSINMGAGQQAAFAGRDLAQVQVPAFRQDDFDQWAADRNRLEDQSLAARYVPRGVVGYSQLDQYGQWSQDPSYGAVWYPQVTVADWAPYRYGRWEWISPWGWTWIDDAPWGFAPFHYGRWTMIGSRWAWVPGRMVARPVYSPALVVFVGDGGASFGFSSGPGVGWYPLAPGEAWYPAYRTSPRYVSFANFNINLNAYPRNYRNHYWAQRPYAITAVPQDTFRRGLPVYRNWQPVQPHAIAHGHFGVAPARPDMQRRREFGNVAPRLQSAPPAQVAMPQRFFGRELPPAVRDQAAAQREQYRLQRDAERNAREQIRQGEEARRQQDPRWQREQVLREQQERAGRMQAERAQREQWQRQQQDQAQRQREDAFRQQRELQRQQQESFRQQRELQQRQQQEAVRQQQEMRAQQERAQREAWQQRQQAEQAQRQQFERGQREAWQRQREMERMQPRAMVPQQQVQSVMQPQPRQAPAQVQAAPPPQPQVHAVPPQQAERGHGGWRGREENGGPPERGHWQR